VALGLPGASAHGHADRRACADPDHADRHAVTVTVTMPDVNELDAAVSHIIVGDAVGNARAHFDRLNPAIRVVVGGR
jgi:hypothetical protein